MCYSLSELLRRNNYCAKSRMFGINLFLKILNISVVIYDKSIRARGLDMCYDTACCCGHKLTVLLFAHRCSDKYDTVRAALHIIAFFDVIPKSILLLSITGYYYL